MISIDEGPNRSFRKLRTSYNLNVYIRLQARNSLIESKKSPYLPCPEYFALLGFPSNIDVLFLLHKQTSLVKVKWPSSRPYFLWGIKNWTWQLISMLITPLLTFFGKSVNFIDFQTLHNIYEQTEINPQLNVVIFCTFILTQKFNACF